MPVPVPVPVTVNGPVPMDISPVPSSDLSNPIVSVPVGGAYDYNQYPPQDGYQQNYYNEGAYRI